MSKPKLSVLMANYNHGHYLNDSLSAIVAQSYEPTEIMVVDDGSSDNSVEILERFARSTPNFRFLRNDRNRGTLYTINRAIVESTGDCSTGDCLCFCSADDKILPGLFEESISLLEKYPDAGACSAKVKLMDSVGENKGVFESLVVATEKCFIAPGRAEDIFRRQGTWYIGPAAVFRRQAFFDVGGLRPELGPMADDFLFMAIALRHGVCHIPVPLAIWRRMETSYSSVTHANPKAALAIISDATHLMRTNFRDIFSEALIARLEGRWLFHGHARSFCSHFLVRPRSGLLRLIYEVCSSVVLGWLFLRFRAKDLCDVIRRRRFSVLRFWAKPNSLREN